MARQFDFDENKLRPMQRDAALLLVEYEFTPRAERRTKQEIADELGVTRKTLHKWDTQDTNFINYKNHLAGQYTDTSLAMVYSKLLESINNGSVRGIETFLKRIGDLDRRSEMTIKTDGDDRSFDEKKDELMERLKAAEASQEDKED